MVGYAGFRFVKHEQWQSATIHLLEDTISSQAQTIEEKKTQVDNNRTRLNQIDPILDEDAKAFISNCNSEHYNMLCLGNYIKRHLYANYWWSDDRGMASTSTDSDFVHVATNIMSEKQDLLVNEYSYNYATWETQSYDRAETYPMIDKYLNASLDVVVNTVG